MIHKIIVVLIYLFLTLQANCQDSTLQVGAKMITLSEVVVNNKLNVPSFIERVKEDTSFYKAFRNLRVLGFTAINDIRMNNSDGVPKATLRSKTIQNRVGQCRSMKKLEEQVTGNMYTADGAFNYYTAQLYASLFFTIDSVCGETNIVTGKNFNPAGKSGMEKHKEQLKMLFFNPGKRIRGIPFMGDKTAIYDDEMANKYTMSIDLDEYNKTSCYIFKQQVKPGEEANVVLDEMTTWFNDKTYEVVARTYTLSFDAGFYDFKVSMEVTMTKYKDYLVPSLIRYNGNWKALFNKRERGVFTATLFDFNEGK